MVKTIGVIGNEACDADSIVSAIVYAHLKNLDCSGPETQYIPFVQCSVADLPDRLDFVAVAGIAKVDVTALGVRSIESASDIDQWILIDHHEPSHIMLKHISSPHVVEIIDHHEILTDTARAFVNNVAHVDIRVIGSCCSIVAERVLSSPEALPCIPPSSLFMLLLVILLDTGNFSESAKKTTAADIAVFNQLKQALSITGSTDTYHTQLVRAKFSEDFWYHSPTVKLFNHDYKLVEPLVGYSVVLRSLDGISDQEVIGFAEEKKLHVFLVACGFFAPDNSLRRELIIFCANTAHLDLILPELPTICSISLIERTERVARFTVQEESFARKKFAPKFIALLKAIGLLVSK